MNQPSPTLDKLNNVGHSIQALIAGFLGGPILLLGGLAVLFFGEQSGARDTLALDEGQRQVVAAATDRIDPELDGKLIHVSGVTTIAGPVQDPQFGIAENAVKLERVVEMLQWVEKLTIKGKVDSYRTEWKSELVDSRRFEQQAGHQNPNFFPFESAMHRNPQIMLGARQLNASQATRIPADEPREITENEFREMADLIKIPAGKLIRGELHIQAVDWCPTAPEKKLNPDYQPLPGQQEVGNVRIRFRFARPGELTVVAGQSGQSFVPFPTSSDPIDLVRVGLHDKDSMFQQARSDSLTLAWGLRVMSLFCITIGCCTLMFGFGAIASLTGAASELPAFRFGSIGTIVLITLVVVICWHKVDLLFTAATVTLAVVLVGGIVWTLRPRQPPKEEVIQAEYVNDFKRKYS